MCNLCRGLRRRCRSRSSSRSRLLFVRILFELDRWFIPGAANGGGEVQLGCRPMPDEDAWRERMCDANRDRVGECPAGELVEK